MLCEPIPFRDEFTRKFGRKYMYVLNESYTMGGMYL